MKKFMFGIFAALFGINANAQIEPADWTVDPTETTIGVHLISDYGNGQTLLSKEISNKIIATEINKLDWVSNFYQFVVVSEPGVSMEVGGSLNGIDGLSAMYRNRHNRIDAVINEAPETVLQMQNILEDFILGNDLWQKNMILILKHTEKALNKRLQSDLRPLSPFVQRAAQKVTVASGS